MVVVGGGGGWLVGDHDVSGAQGAAMEIGSAAENKERSPLYKYCARSGLAQDIIKK